MEMWKMRGMEVQMSQHKPFSNKESVRWGQYLIWTTWNQLTAKLIQYCVSWYSSRISKLLLYVAIVFQEANALWSSVGSTQGPE